MLATSLAVAQESVVILLFGTIESLAPQRRSFESSRSVNDEIRLGIMPAVKPQGFQTETAIS